MKKIVTQKVSTIVSMLTDIVSKNGNLMLNIPLRGDGSPDERELEFLAGLTTWMDVNSEGVYATRPVDDLRRRPVHDRRAGSRLRTHAAALHRRRHSLHHEGRHALRVCRSVA
jgi:alpha-L-fucosidase